MKTGIVTSEQIAANPGLSLRASDYLDPDREYRRDVSVKISGEAAVFIRKMARNNGVTMRDVVIDIVETYIHWQPGMGRRRDTTP
jgi:hypothetical protein